MDLLETLNKERIELITKVVQYDQNMDALEKHAEIMAGLEVRVEALISENNSLKKRLQETKSLQLSNSPTFLKSQSQKQMVKNIKNNIEGESETPVVPTPSETVLPSAPQEKKITKKKVSKEEKDQDVPVKKKSKQSAERNISEKPKKKSNK